MANCSALTRAVGEEISKPIPEANHAAVTRHAGVHRPIVRFALAWMQIPWPTNPLEGRAIPSRRLTRPRRRIWCVPILRFYPAGLKASSGTTLAQTNGAASQTVLLLATAR